MSLYTQYRTDESAELDGVWFPFPQPDGQIVELLIARSGGGNNPYKRELRKIMRKFSGSLQVPIEQHVPAQSRVIEAMANHLLKGWRTKQADGKVVEKLEDDKGKLQPYTVNRAITLLTNLPELRFEIQVRAQDFHNYQGAETEEISGNSSPPSSGG